MEDTLLSMKLLILFFIMLPYIINGQTNENINENSLGSCRNLVQCLTEQNLLLKEELAGLKQYNDYYEDCAAYRTKGYTESGMYTIRTMDGSKMRVYCDMDTSDGGWLVFQRRQDGSENFYRNWKDYQDGFGQLDAEFWLGNEKLAAITEQDTYELRVDLEDFDGEKRFALYSEFSVDGNDKYRLTLGSYSGTAGDSLTYHNGYKWTTFDQDNDIGKHRNCAFTFKGAWWYKNCLHVNLNGEYLGGPTNVYAQGVIWQSFRRENYSLKFTEMKLRPAGYTPPE